MGVRFSEHPASMPISSNADKYLEFIMVISYVVSGKCKKKNRQWRAQFSLLSPHIAQIYFLFDFLYSDGETPLIRLKALERFFMSLNPSSKAASDTVDPSLSFSAILSIRTLII